MFKTILTNILSIHKPRVNNDGIMVNIKVLKKWSRSLLPNDSPDRWATVNWHVFKLPNRYQYRYQSLIIDDIKIEAEIME